ncbi:hypothetical protein FB45DRAFT_909244 [Roridomyces roridus]|uniref:Transmembrane protein n=1 Tax=Roridomyces roridus TaxID=1738132 RepID=A0AAD7FS18_9AGAR|nr:hypothetical protein FB45DRAFT_909244 [Roridomyces roridus]
MPNWGSLAELGVDEGVFVKFMHSCAALYAWEWFISLPFDWEVLTGRKRFAWPLIFYFANRYLLLGAMVGILVALDATTEINCQAVYTFNQFAGDAALGLASINLSLRTIAIWSQAMWIKILLTVIILGHWSLILQGVLLKAAWVADANTCQIVSTNNKILAATFTYSMCFDLIVFLLNLYKLGSRRGASGLTKMIFKDGLVFFFVAFLSNLIATVFMFLDLNPIMSVIFNVPAAIASTIVATRAVRRLTNFTSQGPEMYQPSSSASGGFSSGGYRGGTSGNRGTTTANKHMQPGVHVQMETFVRAEEPVSPTEYSITEVELKRQTDVNSDYDMDAKGSAV